MNEKTNYGRIIAIMLSVITAAAAVAFIVYRLLRNLIAFCAVYDEPASTDDPLSFDEIDEACTDDTQESAPAPDSDGVARET